MKVFLITRTKNLSWCEDHSIVVVAEDEKHAERKARLSSEDFEKDKFLKIKEIDLTEEQTILKANTGA